MDSDHLLRAYYQAWLKEYLNRPQPTIERDPFARARAAYEVECLEHMWALPEREEP